MRQANVKGMGMITKTYDETLATLREVVAEAGKGFVYQHQYGETCYYSIDGEPACIVGRVLAKWGIDLTRMDKAATLSNSSLMGMYADSLLSRLHVEGVLDVDNASAILLAEAQFYQDSEWPWGEALNAAHLRAEQAIN